MLVTFRKYIAAGTVRRNAMRECETIWAHSRNNFVADRMKQALKSAQSVDSLSRLERSTQWNLSRLKMDT